MWKLARGDDNGRKEREFVPLCGVRPIVSEAQSAAAIIEDKEEEEEEDKFYLHSHWKRSTRKYTRTSQTIYPRFKSMLSTKLIVFVNLAFYNPQSWRQKHITDGRCHETEKK